MTHGTPRFDASTYDSMVCQAAYQFLHGLASSCSGNGEVAEIAAFDDYRFEDVGRIICLSVPERYPQTVRAHSNSTVDKGTLVLAKQTPSKAHTVIARALFQQDILAVTDEIIDQVEYITRHPDSGSITIEGGRLPPLPNATAIQGDGATQAEVSNQVRKNESATASN